MSVNYQGLLVGNHDPISIARLIQTTYGGSGFSVRLINDGGYYQIVFNERLTAEQEALGAIERMRRKISPRTRSMSFWTDGECACDYADITSEPMTLVDLGRHGDCKEIIDGLVGVLGGYVKDEAVSHDWVKLS